ncbi:MAG: DNA-binding protein WhiA [Candidatus Muiribacteriaceae bacterium]
MGKYTERAREEVRFTGPDRCCRETIFITVIIMHAALNRYGNRSFYEFHVRESSAFRKLLPIINSMNINRGEIRCSFKKDNSIKGLTVEVDESTLKGRPLSAYLFDNSLVYSHIEKECCFRNMMKALFLLNGSMTDPDKQYFLEINLHSHEKLAVRIVGMMKKHWGIRARINHRSEQSVIYIKKYDDILKILSMLSCNSLILDLENRSVIKQIKSGVNRGVNCEMKNLEKKIKSSQKHIRLFKKVIEEGLSDILDEKSYKVLITRIEYPDMSLSEMAEHLDMTKSQVNYYIKKIQRKYLKYQSNLVHS